MKKKIAVTGGIGSGKSIVCKLLTGLGETCLSCDEISKKLWLNTNYRKALALLFPTACKNGEVDKGLLSQLVFSDKAALAKLNAFSHPKIMECLYAEMESCQSVRVFAEVPLLLEGGYEKDFDKVIVVMRDKAARVQAVMARDKSTLLQVENKIFSQYDYDNAVFNNEKFIVINNNVSLEKLRETLAQILNSL